MASFKVLYSNGSVAKNTKVTISVDSGGMNSGITDSRGHVNIPTSNSYGKIIVQGKTVYHGSLGLREVYI